MRKISKAPPGQAPAPAQEATLADLVMHVNSRSEAIRTLVATVDFAPTTGSVYSGVIKEYHDVKGFILLEKPAMIRMIGQAPVVRTQIFDMVSDGDEFRLYLAPKQKFIVGKNATARPAKSTLENMRPQHIQDALLIPPIDASRERYFGEQAEDDSRRYYVITLLNEGPDGELNLTRKVWFDRADLEIARLQIYGRHGLHLEDVQYSRYRDFAGVLYPSTIEVVRPIEDYRLVITIQKATFNQPIDPEKFQLKKPERAELVELSASMRTEDPRGE